MDLIQRGARAACAGLVLLVAACGGGGGGGGGTSDLSTAPGITVSPTSLSFVAIHNGALPPTQAVQITISALNAAFIGMAVPAGNSPTWLDLSQARLTRTSWTAAIVSTNLAPGTYTTTLQIGIGDISGNVLAYRNVQVSYTVTPTPIAANPNSLNFSTVVGAAAPAAQTTTLSGDIGSWTASADQTWITVPASGTGTGLVNIGVNPSGLTTPTTYNGTVTFTSGANTAQVTVSLTVAAPGIQTSQTSLSFSGINGATLASQPLTITMNNGVSLSWTASTPLPDTWLVLDRASGTQADTLNVSVNPANGSLAFGVYNSSITLQGLSGGSPFNKTVNVTLTLTKATLTPNPASVTLGGTNGRDFSSVQVQLSLNTGANSFSWSSTVSSFIQRSPSSGSVNATPVSVTLTPDPTGLTGGTHSGSLTFSAPVNGDTVSVNVPVTFNLEAHKLLVDGNGVAFAKTPSLSTLTRTLKVRDNLGLSTSWTATKTQSWLTITPSGTAGDNLVLTANPAGLATDTLHFDTVTIDSPDTSVENRGTEKVQVGFWVGSADPAASTSIVATFSEVAADPIRPYAYLAGTGGNIQVYNVYTASLVTTISSVAAQVGAMTVSHDGSKLYAIDTSNYKVVPVDLTSFTVGTTWSLTGTPTNPRLAYTRTNGVGLVLSGDGRVYDASTGAAFSPTFFGAVAQIAAAKNGSLFCAETVCRTLDHTSLNGGQLLMGGLVQLTPSVVISNVNDVAINDDATRVYLACGSPYDFLVFDGANGSQVGIRPGAPYPNNAEVTTGGRFVGGSFTVSPKGICVYDQNGSLINDYAAGGFNLLARQLQVSGDGIRMVTLTGNLTGDPPTVIFTTIGP